MQPATLEQLLEFMVDNQMLSVAIDITGCIRQISKDYAKLLGVNAAEAIGTPIEAIIPNTGLLNVLKTGREELGRLFFLQNKKPAICNRYPIRDSSGTLIGAMSTAVFRDLDSVSDLALEVQKLKRENEFYEHQLALLKKQTPFSLDTVVGASPVISAIKETITKIADTNLCVLLTGETGVGKEVFATAVQQLSNRRYGNFVKVNCAAIPHELMESELFGYEEGSFSGAKKGGKIGRFEQANNGTILLDEISEMPLRLQPKLLRVLQEKEFERVGGTKTLKVNVRVICCTNQNLEAQVKKNLFRQDLFYRINTIEIAIPPLRERLEDIPLLCDHFIKKINTTHGCNIESISSAMLENFTKYEWPGNVRELEHVLERACVLIVSGILDEANFDFFLSRVYKSESIPENYPALSDTRGLAEKNTIIQALKTANGNKTVAAANLKISRTQFYEKLKKYNIR